MVGDLGFEFVEWKGIRSHGPAYHKLLPPTFTRVLGHAIAIGQRLSLSNINLDAFLYAASVDPLCLRFQDRKKHAVALQQCGKFSSEEVFRAIMDTFRYSGVNATAKWINDCLEGNDFP